MLYELSDNEVMLLHQAANARMREIVEYLDSLPLSHAAQYLQADYRDLKAASVRISEEMFIGELPMPKTRHSIERIKEKITEKRFLEAHTRFR